MDGSPGPSSSATSSRPSSRQESCAGSPLDDALDLVALIAQVRPDRLEPAAIRWHGRLEIEAKSLTLAESRFALAALERLPRDPSTYESLRRLLRQVSPTTLRPIG